MSKKINTDLHHLRKTEYARDEKVTPLIEDDVIQQRVTKDVYEHACTITAWQQLYDQLQPGHFQGELTEMLFDDIQMFREYTSLALRQSCMVWPNAFWFGIPATHGQKGFIGTQLLGKEEIAARPGGTEFELSTPDEYTILGVVIANDVLFRNAGLFQQPDVLFELLQNNSALDVCQQKKETIWRFINEALAHGSHDPECMRNENVRRVLTHNLLSGMSELLESAQPVASELMSRKISYQRLVSQARDCVLSRTSEPLTVLELCNELHVSRRTLQNGFHAVLGIGPNAWLKTLRLNAVRRELISPWSNWNTVKDAAMHWGFWHLGQFATDYQRLFLEKPSETLHLRGREWQ